MIFGIDTASVAGNKNINWTKAKAEGPISFAILRSNYGDQEDTQYAKEIVKANEAKLITGAYCFVRFPRNGKKAPDIRSQADVFIKTYKKFHVDLPPIMDIEFPGDGIKETGLTLNRINNDLNIFYYQILNTLHVRPIIYTSARVWKEDLKNTEHPDFTYSPLWLARYPFKAGPAKRDAAIFADNKYDPPVPPSWGDSTNWWFHQYQGDATEFPGFSGAVDMNRFNTMIKGAKGDRVKWIQHKIGIAENGKFDDDMLKAVKAYQGSNALVDDGIIGPKTFAYLAWSK
jgi:GH25 family lysozyme M1 (1,4-beta-N-acetylmuramidase)